MNFLDAVDSMEFEEIEDPRELIAKIRQSDCNRCDRCEFRRSNNEHKIIVGGGNPDADLWVVGKSPGIKDSKEGAPFAHGSGDLLRKMLNSIGYNWNNDCFLTNPVFCPAENDKAPTVKEMKQCSFYMDLLVKRGKPRAFLALGNLAYYALTGRRDKMEDLAGSQQSFDSIYLDDKGDPIPVWVVYHPAYFMRDFVDEKTAKRKTWDTLRAMAHRLEKSDGQ